MRPEQTGKSFWNQAADENPYWYVSSYGPYNVDRNLDEFWASGQRIWTEIKRVTGYTPKPGHTVVEIGCGVGRLTRAIAPEVGRVIALDISEGMLAIARQANLSNTDFRAAEGFVLPDIPSASTDLALGYCLSTSAITRGTQVLLERDAPRHQAWWADCVHLGPPRLEVLGAARFAP